MDRGAMIFVAATQDNTTELSDHAQCVLEDLWGDVVAVNEGCDARLSIRG